MKKLALSLLFSACLFAGGSAIAQTMTSTATTIDLDNTCINQTFIGGTYTLTLSYLDLDNGFVTQPATSCTVTSNGVNHLEISVPGLTLPTPATNGYWSLPDADNGSITLTGGWSPGIIYWYHDPTGTLRFNCVPLPIYFSAFHATISGTTMALSWTTQTEQNTTFIEVYRSGTGSSSSYYKIGQVTAGGNTTGARNYTFTDPSPVNGHNFYMLKMLNSQGTQAVYSIIALATCSACHGTLPAAVNCPYTINGSNAICTLETRTLYTLSSPVPNYSTITWSVSPSSLAHASLNPSFDRTQVTLLRKNSSGTVTLTATLSGCTNTISRTIGIALPGDCGGGLAVPKSEVTVNVSPNPANGLVRISLTPSINTAMSPNATITSAVTPKMYQVRILDASGTVRKTFSYTGGQDNVTVDLSGLNGGIYTVQVFNNKTWTSGQLLLTK